MIDTRVIKRVGASVNPKKRQSQYQSKGLSGVMYYAATTNMKAAENRLLRACKTACTKNIQTSSNVKEKKGFVYGKKR